MLLLLLTLAAPPTDLDRLQGEWLPDRIDDGSYRDGTTWHWQDRLTVVGDVVTLSQPNLPHGQTWPSRLRLRPDASPKQFDWQTAHPHDASLVGRMLSRPYAKGIYRFDGETLVVCAGQVAESPRPTAFAADNTQSHTLARFRRWTGKPGVGLTTGTLTVRDPDGKPLAGAVARKREGEQVIGTTAADGTLTADVVDNTDRVVVTHAGRGLIGFVEATPAGWHHGLTATLAPAVRVTGRVVGLPTGGRVRVSVRPPHGQESARGFGFADVTPDAAGRFAYDCPPGDWRLEVVPVVAGVGRASRPLAVPAGRGEFEVGEVAVRTASTP